MQALPGGARTGAHPSCKRREGKWRTGEGQREEREQREQREQREDQEEEEDEDDEQEEVKR